MTGLRNTPACQPRGWGRGCTVGLMLMLLLMLLLQATGLHAEPVQVRRAWITEAGTSSASEREVSLPDAWEHTAPRRDGAVRYRLDLPDDALQVERPALYLRRVGNIFRVHLNGQSVAEVGAYTRPLPNYNQEPQLVRLPEALVQPSGNRVEIEVIGAPRREAGLSTVWVGAMAELEPEYERAMDLQVRGAWLLASACATMGALGMLLAWRTQQPMYGWFALANLVWAWRIAALSSHDAGIWVQALQWAFEMSYAVFVGAIAMFLLAMVGRDRTIGRQLLAAYIAITLVLSLANAVLNLPVLRTLHLLLTLMVTSAMAIFLAHYSLKERSRTGALLCLGALTGVTFGARDWIAFRLHHDYEAYTGARYAIVLLLFVMGWRLVDDYARTLVRLRELNRNLQDTVDHKQRELEQLFETRREIERQQATTAERDRILREMHDGLGGRLVGAIALAHQLGQQTPTEAGTLQELQLALDDCLTELRLSLDSLEADQRTFGEALAELRFRIEPSLRAAGIRLVWSVDDGAMSAELAAGATLQVLRIVREAFTNIIKHAEASVVRLTLRREAAWLELSVLDNGLERRSGPHTPRPALPPSGKRGVSNMRARAASLGAEIEIGATAEGWAVRVRLPVA